MGNDDTNGGYSTKWANGGSTAGSGSPVVGSANKLTYSGLANISGESQATSYGIKLATAASKNQAALFTTQSGSAGSEYVSFLIQLPSGTLTARNVIGLNNGSTVGSSPPLMVGYNASGNLVLKKSGATITTTTTALTRGQTYFVVARYNKLEQEQARMIQWTCGLTQRRV